MADKGQYFTKNKLLQNESYEMILNNPTTILEPSIGRGDLVNYVKTKNDSIKFDMYELDDTIELLDNINKDDIIYGDFLQQKIDVKYKTILGNPPYIRTTNGNLYIDFIEKCYHLLQNNGELIFIIPSDFFKLTSAKKIINIMLENGSFTHIFHPHNEKLFDNASIDVIIFRYCKNKKLQKKVLYNEKMLFINNNDGMITFTDKKINTNNTFNDYFDIYVGMVSGKDSVFKNDKYGNIEVINGKDKIDKFIYIKEFPTTNEELNKYLSSNKDILLERKIKKFNNNNWFEWGAPRNITKMEQYKNKKCIYIHNLTRKDEVAFVDKVKYFGGNLIMLIPKQKISLSKIVKYINSDNFKKNFMYSNRFKIGHRQLTNMFIPDKYIKKK